MSKKKSLINSMAYNTWYTMINLLFPLITMPYLARVLGADGVGKVNFAASIVSYFIIIAALGVPLYGIREIANVREDKKKLEKTFNEILLINTISSLISIILYLIIIQLDIFSENRILLYINGLTLLFNIVNIDWFYRGLEEYRYITIRSTIIKIISLICIFAFVREKNDFIIYGTISVLALNINHLWNIIHSRKFVKINFRNLNLKKHLKPIFVLVSVDLAVSIYVNLDTTMLGVLCNSEVVGYYTNSIKINKIIVSVVTSITTVLLPRLSYYIKNDMREEFQGLVSIALKTITFISIPATIGVFILSKPIVDIFLGIEFTPAIATIKILSLLITILAVGNLFGTQILIPIGKENYLLKSVMCGAIINFILNLILIPRFNNDGAAMASVIAEFFVMLIQIIFVKKFFDIKIFNKDLIKIIFSSLIMVIGINSVENFIVLNQYIIIILEVLIGGSLYLISNILLRENTTIMVLDKAIKIVHGRVKNV
ncbi:flippase [Clostridium sp. CTA-7]